jgi:RNA polymerase sigma-70 factor (TIGR02943 family)
MNPSAWIDQYSDELFAFARKRVNDRETALDLVQDTFLSALKSKESFRGEMSEKNWLYFILRNKIIDYYRKKKETRMDMTEETDPDDIFYTEKGPWKKQKAPDSTLSDAPVNSDEFMKILVTCRGKLTDVQQAVFNLKYLEDMESEEICKELEISASNYWVILHRARIWLRDCLEKNWLKA